MSQPFDIPCFGSDHGWPIADCTSEGMKGALVLHDLALKGLVGLGRPGRLASGWGKMRDGLISKEVR